MNADVSYDWTNTFANMQPVTSTIPNANTREELEKIAEDKGFGDFVGEKISGASEYLGDKSLEHIFKPMGEAIVRWFDELIHLLNLHSVEIITGGIVLGALGMMLGPLIGKNAGEWLGRILFIGTVGSFWRMAI